MSAHREAALPLDGARVLVVEDEFIVSLELQMILADAGADVVGPCRTAQDAFSLLDQDGLSAALLDLRLGEATSVPVARELERRGIPFVFYTGQANTEPILAEWPESKVLAKPAAAQTIVEAVADLLAR
ncbi:MAG TPA: response regulator [Xanthobacteraceae bacterium]|nr:response regulator [Xanthobacteraceae bacterium]